MKKILIFSAIVISIIGIISLFTIFDAFSAINLWNFYQENELPYQTCEQRIKIAEQYGIDGYDCSAEKNQELLEYLQGEGEEVFGYVSIPKVVALFETSLQEKISATATSMTLVSATDKDGNALASAQYGFIIDEGSSNEEFVLADCTSTACVDMIRGVSVVDGKTEVSALQKAHRRGAPIKLTNFPQIAILSRIISGSDSTPKRIYYSESISSGFSAAASSSALADKNYVDSVGAGGFTASNVGTNFGLRALATSPETVGIDLLASASGLEFSGGDLYVITSSSQGLTLDGGGQLMFVASNSFTFSGNNIFSGNVSLSADLEADAIASISNNLYVGNNLFFVDTTDNTVSISGGFEITGPTRFTNQVSMSEDWELDANASISGNVTSALLVSGVTSLSDDFELDGNASMSGSFTSPITFSGNNTFSGANTFSGNNAFTASSSFRGNINLTGDDIDLWGDALTASASELNKLDGAGASVSATNLNTLVEGPYSDAGALHTHPFGAWDIIKDNNIKQASVSDGFIVAYGDASGNNTAFSMAIYTDSSNPPTTIRAKCEQNGGANLDFCSVMSPIRRNDYYEVEDIVVSGASTSFTVYWIPTGQAP